MKLFDLTKKKYYAEGANSQYFKLGLGKGLKVYTQRLTRVQTEFKVMEILHRARLGPKPYEIVQAKVVDEYSDEIHTRYGIISEFIPGRPVEWRNDKKFLNFIRKIRSHVRVDNNDLFGSNVLLCRKRKHPVVVDFGWLYPKKK